jgi:type I restriction enzyme S subunit
MTVRIEQEISLFNEYRTRLISDVVTGKMDVRTINIPDYESFCEMSEDDKLDGLSDNRQESSDSISELED